jgi:hypothetical protein
MELNWFIIYLFLWFYLRINSLWTALTALRRAIYEGDGPLFGNKLTQFIWKVQFISLFSSKYRST